MQENQPVVLAFKAAKNQSLQTKLGVQLERWVFRVSKLQLTFYQIDIRTTDRRNVRDNSTKHGRDDG